MVIVPQVKMIWTKLGIIPLSLILLLSPIKVSVTSSKHATSDKNVKTANDTITQTNGTLSKNASFNEHYQRLNRSRKDYIIAIEDSAPMQQRYDPVFMMLNRLAKRTQGQMAVLDYSEANKRFLSPFLSKLRQRNPFFNEDDSNYDDDDEEGEEDDSNFRPGGKQSLIGRNVINNFLGMKRLPVEEERLGPRDNVRTVEDETYEDRRPEFAPSVVYEMAGGRQDDYDDDEDEDDNDYSRGMFDKQPNLLFGNVDSEDE